MNDSSPAAAPQARVPAPAPRAMALVYVQDRDSEGVIRQSLSDLGVANAEFASGGIESGIAALGKRASPRLLVVDIAGIADPMARVHELAEVCEPGVGVVAIGDSNDIRVYRSLKDAGIVEYFFKPLVGNLVTRTFNAILTGGVEQRGSRTGKLIFAMASRGGSGATTIAVNTAWHLAETGQRRVLLIDFDLQFGDAALQLDAVPSHALREALEHPERVDDLFLERAVTHVTGRLDLLAALESLNDGIPVDDQAALSLLGNLLHRYRYVFVDMPSALAPRLMRLLAMPGILLLVSTGSLVSARDIARWRQQIGANTPERSTLHILNKSGAHGSLPEAEFLRAAGQPPDVVIPYAREIGTASNLGIQAVHKCASLQRGLAPLYRHLAGEHIDVPLSLLGRLFG